MLADEMGLGKTMQAITAVRLLLARGRDGQRAAGLPQAVGHQLAARIRPMGARAAGNGDRRRSAARALAMAIADAPVKIANYELCCRDAEMIADGQLQFDLVVLDEAQRIKNRASATNEAVCGISPQPQLGADRHAGRELARRSGRAFSNSSARDRFRATMKPRAWAGLSATTCCAAPKTRC